MNIIVSVHVREGTEALAQTLSAAAQELAAGRPLTNWVDTARTVYRCQFELRLAHESDSISKLFGHFRRAAGDMATQVIVVLSTPLEERTLPPEPLPAPTLVVPPVPRAATPPRATEPMQPVVHVAPAPASTEPVVKLAPPAPTFSDSAEPTVIQIPKVLPGPLTSPRLRASAQGQDQLIEFAVRACEADGLRGFVIATGQPLTLQVNEHWDVVEGEILTFKPLRFWRFARNSLASGAFVAARIETGLFGGKPLRLVEHDGGWELEKPVLEGDPDDPADDIMADAQAALRRRRIPDARHLARVALEENIRCLEAHDLLARSSLARGDAPEQALRRDAVLLAFAREAVPAGFSGRLAQLAGNAPVYSAIERLARSPDPRAAELVREWRPTLA